MDYHTSYTMESFTAAPDHITTVENLPEKSAKSNGGARKALTMRKLGASLPPSRAALTNEDLVIDNLAMMVLRHGGGHRSRRRVVADIAN